MADTDSNLSYFIRVRGKVFGPYDVAQLKSLRARSQFSRANEVSIDRQTWESASTIWDRLGGPASSGAIRTIGNDANVAPRQIGSGPPSRGMPAIWHFAKGGEQCGPVTLTDLQRRLSGNELTLDDVVWREGLADWLPIRDVAELQASLGSPGVTGTPYVGRGVPASSGANRLSGTASFEMRIGREADNDIVLDYPMVSPYHARLRLRGGQLELEDLGSVNGTAIGSPDRKIVRSAVAVSDTVFFGSFRVPVNRLLASRTSPGTRGSQQLVSLRNDTTVFGRDPECDQVLDDPMISARHARVTRKAGRFAVEDLGSANGTFINGQRVQRLEPIQPGDELSLGSYMFRLNAAGDFERRDYRGNITIEARGLSMEVPGKRLLENVSLTIYPTEFVGLMGPSGAGKTTLMNILNGYTPPTAGQVLINGQDLYSHYQQFAGQFGYVPQDDIIHGDLTVGEALYYTARLRLPPDFAESAIRDRISAVLKQLGLEGTENVLIGSAVKKGISGGQRKRVNLAQELLTDPSVLFLDEPTSGLSSEDALMVMKVLRGLADSGKAILMTIHQPSLEVYRLMDNLVLVGKDQNSPEPGRLVYYGPAYPDAVRFFNPDGVPGERPGVDPSPDEVLRGLAKRKASEWAERYQHSDYGREYIEQRMGKQARPSAQGSPPRTARTSGVAQWWTLVRRCLTIKFKDCWNTAILLAQAPIVAVLVVLVFGNEVGAEMTDENWLSGARASSVTVFLIGLAALWFGCSNAVREIVGEWAIYHRERMVNLKLPSYVASKLAVLGVLCVVQCGILTGIVAWGCELKGDWLGLFGALLFASIVGLGIGLTISAASRSSEVAVALLPIVLLPMVILGGVLQPVHKMNKAMAVFANIAPSRWTFEATLTLESDERRRGPAPPKFPVMPPAPTAVAPAATDQPSGSAAAPPDEQPKPAEPKAEAAPEKPSEKKKDKEQDEDEETPDVAQHYFPKKDRTGYAQCLMVMGVMFAVLIASVLATLRARDVH